MTKPEPDLFQKAKIRVKKTACRLLESLKGETVLDWHKTQRTRAQVRVTIEEVLDQGLPETYTSEPYQKKTKRAFQHVYDSHYGSGQGLYTSVM